MMEDTEDNKKRESGEISIEECVLTTPHGHALPRPLDRQVTMDLVQRFVETERAKQRRALAVMGLAFSAIVAILVVLFVVAGIFMVRQSRRAAAIATELREQTEDLRDQTASYGAEIVEVSSKMNKIVSRHEDIRNAVEKNETKRAQERRVLMSDLQRFSKWVAERTSSASKNMMALEQELKSLRETIAARDQEITALRKEQEDLRRQIAAQENPGQFHRQFSDENPTAVVMSTEMEKSVADETLAPEAEAEEIIRVERPSEQGLISAVTFPNGDRYEGEFKNGLMEGWGIYTYANGDRYEGWFRNDMRHGKGIMIYRNGDRYEGELQNDMRHGRGVLIFKSGDKYIGEFRNDCLTGKATMLYANGNKYSGDFRNGMKHGSGIFHFSNGDVYDGEFRYDLREGRGTYTFSDGTKYIGEFMKGQRHGYGRYIYAGGEEYVGEFRNGKKEGTGSCIYPDGRELKGIWKEDRLVKILEG